MKENAKTGTVSDYLVSKAGGKRFEELYGREAARHQAERHASLVERTARELGAGASADLRLFSAPGRTELGGNHTDHNRGKVLCGAIQLDAIACVVPVDSPVISLASEGFPEPFIVNLNDLGARREDRGRTEGLIRGIAAELRKRGYAAGGFSGRVVSDVSPGSGLSSSAAIEVLIGTIFNHLYNKGIIPPVEIAKIGQRAENDYFGKPCGLMDQTASAVGGIAAIDFVESEEPSVVKVDFNFTKSGYALVVVNTGGSHADLTGDYASIPAEMKAVAAFFGKETLRAVKRSELLAGVGELRGRVGDRAVLRALHFVEENRRVDRMVEAIGKKDVGKYLGCVRASGASSWELLQNVYPPAVPREQGISLALALTSVFLKDDGACRVHGGGFAGTIQAYVPTDRIGEYAPAMERVFGPGCVTELRIRSEGATAVF